MPLAGGGLWFEDVRGPERKLRISVHEEPGGPRIILSVWRGPICRASFQFSANDVTELIEALAAAAGQDASPTNQSASIRMHVSPTTCDRPLSSIVQSATSAVVQIAAVDPRRPAVGTHDVGPIAVTLEHLHR